jgi:hypothetical protein
MNKKVSRINMCKAAKCVYNSKNKCHAIAITVGGPDPLCDTYLSSIDKGGMREVMGGVGACKVTHCRHNNSFMCQAGKIEVDYHENNVKCMTFERTQN